MITEKNESTQYTYTDDNLGCLVGGFLGLVTLVVFAMKILFWIFVIAVLYRVLI